MCGITGWIEWDMDLTQKGQVLETMARTLTTRGPDAEGMWLSPRAALAHRRLIVIDPEGGKQPMTRRRGSRSYVMVYNGELYNTPELRRMLEDRGQVFAGHSDTEVLLAAYVEWGPECVSRLNGIFAFAIWSEADETLFLARDRLGVKPLFYAERGSGFLFGSELKALLAHPAVKPEVDLEGLTEIFILGPGRTPGHGIFRGISEVKPGHCLLVSRQGIKHYPYWTLESRPHTDDLPTTATRVRELLQDAVQRQLVSDVPICTLLSGGLDSSAITALAHNHYQTTGKGPVDTFSVDYVDNDKHFQANQFQPNSDAPWVRLVSDFLGTRHHYVTIDTPELMEALQVALGARDLPGMTDIDASLYLFCRQIKKEATVALSGECADEVFGGYPWFHRQEALQSPTFPWARLIPQRARLLAPHLQAKLKAQQYMEDKYQEALAEVPRLPGEAPLEARMREMFYLNLTRWMPVLLDRKDRMSMAVGLEVRVPFCDHHLVEYAWNIPWEMKSCDNREKGILRRAMQGLLPQEVLTRKKSPYPKTHHPAYLAATSAWLQAVLDDPNSPLLALVDGDYLRSLLQTQAAAFSPAWFGQLMGGAQLFAYLAQVDLWLRQYKVEFRGF